MEDGSEVPLLLPDTEINDIDKKFINPVISNKYYEYWSVLPELSEKVYKNIYDYNNRDPRIQSILNIEYENDLYKQIRYEFSNYIKNNPIDEDFQNYVVNNLQEYSEYNDIFSKNNTIDYKKIIEASKVARIKDFIESSSMGFETFIGERGIKLSGGQKQRIAIARAIYKQSKLLIFDEATSALDNKTEDEIIKAINNLDSNITIIMIAHRLSSLSVCNKIIELSKGRIISSRNSIDLQRD